MPIDFDTKIYLKKGERPESAKPTTVCAIKPRDDILAGLFDQSDVEG